MRPASEWTIPVDYEISELFPSRTIASNVVEWTPAHRQNVADLKKAK